MRVLVDGAAGFLGRQVVRIAADAGHDVRATDRRGSPLDEARTMAAEVVEADLTDAAAARDLVGGVDAAVHVAGIFDLSLPRAALVAANVTATETLARAAAAAGLRRFVHVSTVGVYGTPARVPMDEGGPFRPKNEYERTKWEGEQAAMRVARETGMPVVSLRPSLLHGPGGRYGFAVLIAALALLRRGGGRIAYGFRGGPRMHHCHVEDAARAAIFLLDRDDGVGRAFNVADDEPQSLGDTLAAVCDTLGLELRGTPWRWPLGPAVVGLARALPDRLRARLNARIARDFARVVERDGLERALAPRIDRDFLGYLGHDHVYETSAIRRLGFRPAHPRLDAARTVEWYMEARWIPRPKDRAPIASGVA